MNSKNSEPDWALWRSFLAVAETGTLSAAARQLNSSQPTIGRHIDALEQSLGLILFERTLQGFKANETALRLGEQVRNAQQALGEARNIAEGQSQDLSGTVRITASEVTGHYILPQMLVKARQAYPAIELEIVPSDSPENLLMREADIAIRMFRPTQLDLITKHVGDAPVCACAHQSYLDRKGTLTNGADLAGHDLIGFDRSDIILDGARQLGWNLNRHDFALRTDSQTLGWELIKSGLGIGFAQTNLVEETDGMVPLLPNLNIPALPIWLTTHQELFTNTRIRAIYDLLSDQLSAKFGHAHPAA